jgi:hypothetical protein
LIALRRSVSIRRKRDFEGRKIKVSTRPSTDDQEAMRQTTPPQPRGLATFWGAAHLDGTRVVMQQGADKREIRL